MANLISAFLLLVVVSTAFGMSIEESLLKELARELRLQTRNKQVKSQPTDLEIEKSRRELDNARWQLRYNDLRSLLHFKREECGDDRYTCKAGVGCVHSLNLCDGKADCYKLGESGEWEADAEDEDPDICSSVKCQIPEEWGEVDYTLERCPDSGKCVPSNLLETECNGED